MLQQLAICLFVDVPAGANFVKNPLCLFVDDPAGANFVKNIVFVMFEGFGSMKNSFVCMVLSLMSMLVLVLKNLIQRTRQHVKRTSGARDTKGVKISANPEYPRYLHNLFNILFFFENPGARYLENISCGSCCTVL